MKFPKQKQKILVIKKMNKLYSCYKLLIKSRHHNAKLSYILINMIAYYCNRTKSELIKKNDIVATYSKEKDNYGKNINISLHIGLHTLKYIYRYSG